MDLPLFWKIAVSTAGAYLAFLFVAMSTAEYRTHPIFTAPTGALSILMIALSLKLWGAI